MSDINKAVQKYDDIHTLLSVNAFEVDAYKSINYGLQFLVRKSSWSGTIRIYQNKKGQVRVDFSQLDQSEYADLVRELSEGKVSTDLTAKAKPDSSLDDIALPVMGNDESGKGDYFGPLVTASIYVDDKNSGYLKALGVQDSKSLSDSRVSEIARDIKRRCQDKFVIIEISPERYNQLYVQFGNGQKSLNDMLAWSHAKALEELLSKVECQTAIVDQFANERLLNQKLQAKGKQLKIIQAHRAESHIAVAAASILARDRFVYKLRSLGKQYETNLPKGASKEVISVAKDLVSQHGKTVLEKVAKTHFKTTKSVLG